MPPLRKEIADKPVMIGLLVFPDRRDVPSRHIRVQPIHECSVISHRLGHRAEQVTSPQLSGYVDLEVAQESHSAFGTYALPAARELAACHVALHDVDAITVLEPDSGDLVERNHVVLGHQSALPRCIVDEELRHCGLAT